MIDELELMRLRDIAFEYLPVARDKMLADAKFISYRGGEYWYQLHHAATRQCHRNMPVAELASVHLLRAIAGYGIGRSVSFVGDELNEDELNGEDLEIYNSITPQERQDWAIDSIAKAVKALAKVTERTISFDYTVADRGTDTYTQRKTSFNTWLNASPLKLDGFKTVEDIFNSVKETGDKNHNGKPLWSRFTTFQKDFWQPYCKETNYSRKT